jgi:hypothetical protein
MGVACQPGVAAATAARAPSSSSAVQVGYSASSWPVAGLIELKAMALSVFIAY